MTYGSASVGKDSALDWITIKIIITLFSEGNAIVKITILLMQGTGYV